MADVKKLIYIIRRSKGRKLVKTVTGADASATITMQLANIMACYSCSQ
jgi:hypothetical protein